MNPSLPCPSTSERVIHYVLLLLLVSTTTFPSVGSAYIPNLYKKNVDSLNVIFDSNEMKDDSLRSTIFVGGYQDDDHITKTKIAFASLEPFYVHLFGERASVASGTLYPTKRVKSFGRDANGAFQRITTDWTSPNWPQDSVYFQTMVQIYRRALIYTQRYPQGVSLSDCSSPTNTSRSAHDDVDDDDDDKNEYPLRSNYPALNLTGLGYYSYHGYFLDHPEHGRIQPDSSTKISDGVEAGPMLLFHDDGDDDRNNNKSSIVNAIVSHYSEFMTQSMHFVIPGGTLEFGPLDTMCPLPTGYEAKTILVLSRKSIIHAVQQWGRMLLNEYMGSQGRSNDYTTRYLGYSTDNGAYYYYKTEPSKNYQETMIAVSDYARQQGIPYKYWLLDSWWYYQEPQGIKGVTNWTARPDIFPDGMRFLFDTTGYHVQAHNRMWAVHNVYMDKYDFVASNTTSLPTEYRFWRDLFASSAAWGLKVYEQDWLNVQFEQLLPHALTNATLMRTWLLQMGEAARRQVAAEEEEEDWTIQYCMPLPRHVLQSVEIPAVTQVRATNDHDHVRAKTQQNWNIGITSLLHWAIQLRPSKDSAWSLSQQPGNRYNATERFPELEALVMAMSTGPVAFSDRIGYSNVSLILRTCRQDGMLLQPEQPLIPIHEWFYRQTTPRLIQGHIQESRMQVPGLPYHYAIVFATMLEQDFVLRPNHLFEFPRHHKDTVVYDASLARLERFGDDDDVPLILRKSPVSSIVPVDYQLYFVAPVFYDWCLLGERHKFVPLSCNRFISVNMNPYRLILWMQGSMGEVVDIAYAFRRQQQQDKEWIIQRKSFTIPASGRIQVQLTKDLPEEHGEAKSKQ